MDMDLMDKIKVIKLNEKREGPKPKEIKAKVYLIGLFGLVIKTP